MVMAFLRGRQESGRGSELFNRGGVQTASCSSGTTLSTDATASTLTFAARGSEDVAVNHSSLSSAGTTLTIPRTGQETECVLQNES